MNPKGLLIIFLVSAIPSMAWGQRVGTEFRVNTYTTDQQRRPTVSSEADGSFVVVWESRYQDGDGFGVFGQRYDGSGNRLGNEFRVNSYTTGSQRRPAVASDTDGKFVVVWESYDQDGDQGGIFGQQYDDTGHVVGGEFRVNGYTTGSQRFPSVTFDSVDDFFTVVWSGKGSGDDDGIFLQRFQFFGSGPVPEPTTLRVNTNTTGYQVLPSIASDADGNFVVVWSGEGFGDNSGVFGQRIANTIPITLDGTAFLVNTYTVGTQRGASVAADADGDFFVAWESLDLAGGIGQDGDETGVFGQFFDSSGTVVGGELQVNAYTTSFQEAPSVAADPAGDFVVVWVSVGQDGSDYGIFGKRYDNTGIPLGDEFQVNTYTTGQQDLPAVASDADGDFVVVWDSGNPGQDGDTFGIFGQRFGSPIELRAENAIDFVKDLDASDFSSPNRRAALLSKLEDVLASVRPGDLAGICHAIDKLTHDILPKTDGDPRPPDWVTGFPAQQDLEEQIIALLDDLQDAATALGGCP